MGRELDREIADSLEAPTALLPLLPELFSEVDGPGTLPGEVLAALEPLGLPPRTCALDLGCGKGAVSLALAGRFGWTVVGVDAFLPFVEEARQRALAGNLSHLVTFRPEDLRATLARDESCDVLLYLGLGPLLGEVGRTVGRLRTRVRPGGLLLVNDARLGGEPTHGLATEAPDAETIARLTLHGDELIAKRTPPRAALEALHRTTQDLLNAQARVLADRHPELEGLLFEFVMAQDRAARRRAGSPQQALWVLRRG